MQALKAQHDETAAYIRRRMARPGGLPEAERAAFAALLRKQAHAWHDAGGEPGAFAGAEVLGTLAQAEQPAAPPARPKEDVSTGEPSGDQVVEGTSSEEDASDPTERFLKNKVDPEPEKPRGRKR